MMPVVMAPATAPRVPAAGMPAQPGRVFCRVSIRMRDGSRGVHEDWYPHACDALNRALDLFPDAQVISVAASRGIRRVL
jgi:hypothetical protein